MHPGIVCLVGALIGQTPAQSPALTSGSLSARQRTPIALLFITPSGASGRIRSSELIDGLSQLVQQHTDFFVQSLDATEAATCEGRLSCITRLARPDYQRLQYDLGNGEMAPYTEHLTYLHNKQVVYPRYLLMLSNITGGEEDRMSLTLLDTDRVLEVVHTHDTRAPDSATTLAVKVRQAGRVAEPKWGAATRPDQALSFLQDTFLHHLRGPLEAAGHWEPFGVLEIHSQEGGHAIQLDGVTVGTTQVGRTRVTEVTVGKHTLRLQRPDVADWQGEVEVVRAGTASVYPSLATRLDPTARAVRQVALWTGVGLAVVGTTIAGVALARQDSGVVTYCPTVDGNTACSGSRFTTGGYSPGQAPSFSDEVNPPGVMMGPLGYSLALTGVTWSLGTLLFGADDDIPWWQLGAGVVLGAAAYGISQAVNPASPFSAP